MNVVVIGSGLLGVSTAWALVERGAEVTVLDRAEGPGRETSFANGAMLTPSMADPWNAPGVLWRLLRWVGREDSPMLLRPRALPSLIGWGIRFIRYSDRAALSAQHPPQRAPGAVFRARRCRSCAVASTSNMRQAR